MLGGAAVVWPLVALAQTPSVFAVTKVDGCENVYIFRYVRHQSMFVVTPEGVIATDPIGLRRPAASTNKPGCDPVRFSRNLRTAIAAHHAEKFAQHTPPRPCVDQFRSSSRA